MTLLHGEYQFKWNSAGNFYVNLLYTPCDRQYHNMHLKTYNQRYMPEEKLVYMYDF